MTERKSDAPWHLADLNGNPVCGCHRGSSRMALMGHVKEPVCLDCLEAVTGSVSAQARAQVKGKRAAA